MGVHRKRHCIDETMHVALSIDAYLQLYNPLYCGIAERARECQDFRFGRWRCGCRSSVVDIFCDGAIQVLKLQY